MATNPSDATPPSSEALQSWVDELSNEVRRLRRINLALMGQVERSMDVQGNAFTMFRSSIVLENKVRERTMELRQLNSELSKARNSMAHFIAAASHDLLQPLNAARVFVSALAEQDLNDKNLSIVDNINTAMDATEELLSALLDISRLDAGGQKVSISSFPIARLLTPLSAEFATLAEEKDIEIHFIHSNAVVHSDPQLVSRILRNFLTNAIRYTPRGKILVGARKRGDVVRVGVWDTGIGIPEDKQALIFREFQRLNDKNSSIETGVGLGLAIVERISQQLGLKLITQSREGRGSYFGVEIPKGKIHHSQIPKHHGNYKPVAKGLPKASVLVIDNEPSILDAMQTLLASWDCDAIVASNQEQALDLLKAQNQVPDIVIADYHLDHGKTGTEAIRVLRKEMTREIPFIIITADYEQEVADSTSSLDGYILNKPIKPAKLRSLMSHLLRPV